MTEEDRRVAIAVDGGGSKTTTVCHSLEGKVLGRGRSGATNPNSVGDEAAYAALRDGIEEAVRAAGHSLADVCAVCLGMSGVDRPADKAKVRAWLDTILGRAGVPASIHNDGTIALSCGTHGALEGVVVISGTGTISLGYSTRGLAAGATEPRYVRAAGWGPALGDEGSGHDIGSRVLKAAAFAEDGRGPETLLCAALKEKLGLAAMQELIAWVYDKSQQASPWQRIADVAPLARDCAERGDAVAMRILDDAADGLFVSMQAVARRLLYTSDDAVTFVFAGGLLSNGVLAPRLIARLTKAFPKCKIVQPDCEPVFGAIFLNVAQHPWDHSK
jgi:N-acetylglucosamine kinase-like BadF-type ATPase